MKEIETKPLVSVIIPTYNREKTISESIYSVLNQTYTNIEVIIVDDYSEDNTVQVVSEFSSKRVRIICNSENLGANASRNKGIIAAEGNYIAFQDSDDIWCKNKLEKQMEIMLGERDVGVVYCDLCRHMDGYNTVLLGDEISEYDRNAGISKYLLKTNIVGTVTLLVKKECFNEVGMFDEDMPRLQDWEMCLRLSERYKFRCVDEALVDVYVRDENISSSTVKYAKAMASILFKYKNQMEAEGCWKNNLYKMIYGIYNESRGGKTEMEECINIIYAILPEKWLMRAGISREFITNLARINRNKMYYDVGCTWLERLIDQRDIGKSLLSKQLRHIAIYGAGKYGILLGKQLIKEDSGVTIECYVEKSSRISDRVLGIKVLKMNQLSMDVIQNLDAIIVTPTYEFKGIKEELRNIFSGLIISLEDVVKYE